MDVCEVIVDVINGVKLLLLDGVNVLFVYFESFVNKKDMLFEDLLFSF